MWSVDVYQQHSSLCMAVSVDSVSIAVIQWKCGRGERCVSACGQLLVASSCAHFLLRVHFVPLSLSLCDKIGSMCIVLTPLQHR